MALPRFIGASPTSFVGCFSIISAFTASMPTAGGHVSASPVTLVGAQYSGQAQAATNIVNNEDQSLAGSDYRIGPNDVLSVTVLQAKELDVSTRVSAQGNISLPLIGVVRAAGLTPQQLEVEIERLLSEKYIHEPDVTVQLTELQSQPLSVVGAVRLPGTFQVRGPRTLLEALSLAGGLAEDAGDVVMVLRSDRDGAADGFPRVAPDVTDAREIAPGVLQVQLKPLLESHDPRLNIMVRPGDVVNVQSAAIVYIVGAVKRSGAFAMRGNDRLTVLRALALGEGTLPMAARGESLVVRTNERGERVEIPVNLDDILKGKSPDIELEAQDVFFVPTSGAKSAARATLDALTRIVTLRPPFPY